MNGCCILSNAISLSIDRNMAFFLLDLVNTVDYMIRILSKPCIFGINSNWSWCICIYIHIVKKSIKFFIITFLFFSIQLNSVKYIHITGK